MYSQLVRETKHNNETYCINIDEDGEGTHGVDLGININ